MIYRDGMAYLLCDEDEQPQKQELPKYIRDYIKSLNKQKEGK